jgi:hypothetical protein
VDVEKYERYEISYVPDGLQISTWRALPNLGFGLFALLILAACFLTDPYQGHARIWGTAAVVTLALVAAFGVRLENWIISESDVRYRSSVWSKQRRLARPAGTPLRMLVQIAARDLEGNTPPFPYGVHFNAPGEGSFGDALRFRDRASVERLLSTLHEFTPVEVTELAGRDSPDPAV